MKRFVKVLLIVAVVLGAMLVGSGHAMANRWRHHYHRWYGGPVYRGYYGTGFYGAPYGGFYRPYRGFYGPGFVGWGTGLGGGYVGWGPGFAPGWGGYGYGYGGVPMTSGFYSTSYVVPF